MGLDGIMSNAEIQKLIQSKGLHPQLLIEAAVQQITWDNQWMSYDDETTIAIKLYYANKHCLGGTVIWSIDFGSGSARYVIHFRPPIL